MIFEIEDYRRKKEGINNINCIHFEWRFRGKSKKRFAYCKKRKSFIGSCGEPGMCRFHKELVVV